jgi:tRNA pseudouridine55 synthase
VSDAQMQTGIKLTQARSYSALKMEGKPLYEYARQNLPLPKPIEARDCTIYNLELVGWKNGSEHSWTGAKEELSQEEKDTMQKLENLVKSEMKEEPEANVKESNSLETPGSANQEVKAELDLPQPSDLAQGK